MSKKYLVWFDEVRKGDVGLVGGKGANLGEMLSAGFPVPYGFVVTSHAYFYVIEHNKLRDRIRHALSSINFENTKELHDASVHIKTLIKHAQVPKDLVNQIVEYYHQMPEREARLMHKGTAKRLIKHVAAVFDPPLCAVRSSATAEDLPEASFAGQQETYLNVRGENHLLQMVKECWASLFTERAMYYRAHNHFDHLKVGLAAVVQRMVQSDQSGIAFSIDPVTNDRAVITIEAIYGLGEYIVQGKVTPDHYEVKKSDFSILKKEIKIQSVSYVKSGTRNIERKISRREGTKQKITDNQIKSLAKIIAKVEKHYYFPQDIEWAIEGEDIFVVQSRPITTLSDKTESRVKSDKSETHKENLKLLVSGSPASPGIGVGKPIIIKSPSEIGKVEKGMILVARQTNPDYVPAMKRATGIVTEIGGRTSHAAIVSRELGIPAVVGAQDAIRILKKQDVISVNGATGEVFEGAIEGVSSDVPEQEAHVKALLDKINSLQTGQDNTMVQKETRLKTTTKIYVNLAQTERAAEVAKMNVDGVGLLRAEFIMADIGVHPKKIIKDGHTKKFIKTLSDRLLEVVKPFSPRPVVYRATDFKTNEYRDLKGGAEYEPKEENPMLGFRGASRYLIWHEVFDMELEAIKRIRAKGYKNIHLMIPFLRVPEELAGIKKLLQKHELFGAPSFKLWMMVEVPSAVILLEEFIKQGIDGLSVGTNDLTMLMLGVDRDNPEVAHIYNERNPAVTWALDTIIQKAKQNNVTVSICGQAPSDYPEVVERLVFDGVTSISVNPDAVDRVRQHAYLLETLLWQRSKK